MAINGKYIEELGFKAKNKGFFSEWQILTSELIKVNGLTLDEAAEKALKNLEKSF